MALEKGMEYILGNLEVSMKGFGKMIKEKDKEDIYTIMEIYIMAIGKIIKKKEKEFLFKKMEKDMKVNLKMDFMMVMAK